MELFFILFLVLAVIALTRSFRRPYGGPGIPDQRRPQVTDQEMAGVKRAADEDVTEFGEELQRLDIDLAGRDLDDATRQDYQRALDAYEAAKESVAAVQVPEDIRDVTAILEDGRYAVACVRARVNGEPLPARRPPCFFNPQHGPSARDVAWSPDGGAIRQVPACAADAERVDAGAEPASRQVMVGSRRMPYWEAGPAYAPFGAGYFGAFGLMQGMFLGTMMGASFGAFDGGGFADGQDAGYDGGDGGGDVGGGDFGGGDFGGGDFGGGDFGGFDF